MSHRQLLGCALQQLHSGVLLRQVHITNTANCNSILKPRRLQYGEFLNDIKDPWPHALPNKHIFPHPPLPDVSPPHKRPAPFPNEPIQPQPRGWGEYWYKGEPWRRPFPR